MFVPLAVAHDSCLYAINSSTTLADFAKIEERHSRRRLPCHLADSRCLNMVARIGLFFLI